MVEIILTGLFVLAVLGGIQIYRSDRAGWNATFKRLSRMVRANIESSKPIKGITAKVETRAVESWEHSFKAIEQPKNVIASAPRYGDSVVEPRKLKHAIVKHDYKISSGNMYPRWNCKCGASDYVYVHEWRTLEKAQRDARAGGESHVTNANKAEEMLANSRGNFAW